MRRAKILFISMAVVLLSGFVLVGDWNSIPGKSGNGYVCGASNVLAAPISSDPISEWQHFEDTVYNYTVDYPVGWDKKVNIAQTSPYANSEAIIKRYTFWGKEGLIILDVWLSHGNELSQWLEWYGKTRSELPITSPNARVAGYPAVIFVENGVSSDMLTTFWNNSKYTFRLLFRVTGNNIGLQVYQHMLNTFSLSEQKVMTAELPGDVLKSAHQVAKESGGVSPLVNSCCGYSSTGNPFPCCSNKGNCTWWVYYQYGYVPFTGDAGTWYSQVPNYPDWRRGSQPHTGQDIAWWSGSPGHVAFVPNYTGGMNVYITEMYYCTSCYHTRTISVTNPNGYMWTIYTK